MKAVIIPVTQFQQNCSLVWCEKTLKAAFIDPGGDLDRLRSAVSEHDLTIEKILVTHAHIDHPGGVLRLAREFEVPIEGPHLADQF